MRAGSVKRGARSPVLIRPILFASSVNHRLPSGPTTMFLGMAPGVMPVEYSVIVPDGVMRPILSLPFSANQRLPSGPAAMPLGLLPAVKPEKYSVYGNRFVGGIVPSASPPLGSVNQRLPSAPATM